MADSLPKLLTGLPESDNGALAEKIRALRKIGPGARPALGTLRELTQIQSLRTHLTQPECQVVGRSVQDLSVAAKMAICRIEPSEGRVWLAEIATHIGRSFEPVEFLAQPSILSNEIVRATEPLLDDTDGARQSMAAYAILSQDRGHARALATLRRNRSMGKLNDRLAAGRWLFHSLGETNDLCALLDEAFAAPESHIGQGAGQIAQEMGPAALPSLPAFTAALWHRDKFVRQQAGLLICKLAPQQVPIFRP
jgi:hypothetical protein